MIIAVNTRLLLPGKIEGMGRFTLEMLRIITRKHPEHRFVFMFDRPFSDEFVFSSNITPVVCFPPARHPLLWYGFFELGIPIVLKKSKADLFLSPDGWLSLRTPVKSLPVIHDLNFYHFPQFIPFHIRQYYHYFFPRFIQKAHRICTVSEFTSRDITSRFNYPHSRIDVVYNGSSHGFSPLSVQKQQQVREQYAGGQPYFLFVGLIHPRKNISGLITAYDRFRLSVGANVKLLIAGSRKWWTSDMQEAYAGSHHQHDICFMGRVRDEELTKVMASALGLVYVSHFEGFGIPVLESMYCDTPVICSSASALPEVAGDAALYADPSDVESIKQAMIALYKDPLLRKTLIDKGRIQREKFSWEKTAELLWESVEQCLRP